MSDTDPKKKQQDEAKREIKIPAWWSIVALILAALVYLPIQYANKHTQKPAEVEAKPSAVVETTSAAKDEAKPAETQVMRAAEPVVVEPKPNVAEIAPTAKEEAKPAETPAPQTMAQAEPQTMAQAEPQPKPEAAPPAKEAEATPPMMSAPSAKEAVATAEPQAKAAEQAETKAKPVVAEAASQAKPETAQPKPEIKPAALAKTPAEKQKVDNALIFRIDGKDKEGRAAAFDFVVLSNEYVWALASASQVVSGGKVIREKDAANRIFAPKVRDALAGASDVIGVGLASKDGIRAEEEARALARSKTVATWITKVAKPETALWALTLGQYDKGCKMQEDKESSFERPILFVGVRSKANDANLQEALADALNGHDNLPSRTCYSRFDMVKIR